MERFQRRLQSIVPERVASWRQYAEALRVEFRFRCAYCGIHESELPSERSWQIDHFKPRHRFPGLTLSYDNLYYACIDCNSMKWSKWQEELIDPCKQGLLDGEHVHMLRTGELAPLTTEARVAIDTFRLNRRALVLLRAGRMRCCDDFVRDVVRIVSMRERLGIARESLGAGSSERAAIESISEELQRELRQILRQWQRVKKPRDEYMATKGVMD